MPSSRRTPRRRKRLHFKLPMCGGRERPPYKTGNMRRPTGKLRPRVTTNPCRGRFHIGPGTPRHRKHPGRDLRPKSRRCAAVGLRNAPAGAVNPAPTNEFCASGQTGTAATHPDDRRAGCPHPAAPRGGANVSILNCQCAAGVNARPTKPKKCRGQPGNRGPALQQTPVGDDSISAREPRGTANTPGGINPAPTNKFCASGQTGTAATHPDDRRAGCPHPAAPRGGANVSILNCQCAAGVNARPTKPENCRGQPGNCGPALQQTLVGADSISAREPRGGANAPGGYGIRPYE